MKVSQAITEVPVVLCCEHCDEESETFILGADADEIADKIGTRPGRSVADLTMADKIRDLLMAYRHVRDVGVASYQGTYQSGNLRAAQAFDPDDMELRNLEIDDLIDFLEGSNDFTVHHGRVQFRRPVRANQRRQNEMHYYDPRYTPSQRALSAKNVPLATLTNP